MMCVCVWCNLCSLDQGQATRKHAKSAKMYKKSPISGSFPSWYAGAMQNMRIKRLMTTNGGCVRIWQSSNVAFVRNIVKSKKNTCTVWVWGEEVLVHRNGVSRGMRRMIEPLMQIAEAIRPF